MPLHHTQYNDKPLERLRTPGLPRLPPYRSPIPFIPLKIGSGKLVVGATLVVARFRCQPAYIPLCGLHKAMVISAESLSRTPIWGRNPVPGPCWLAPTPFSYQVVRVATLRRNLRSSSSRRSSVAGTTPMTMAEHPGFLHTVGMTGLRMTVMRRSPFARETAPHCETGRCLVISQNRVMRRGDARSYD